jgi:hypothetical protein
MQCIFVFAGGCHNFVARRTSSTSFNATRPAAACRAPARNWTYIVTQLTARLGGRRAVRKERERFDATRASRSHKGGRRFWIRPRARTARAGACIQTTRLTARVAMHSPRGRRGRRAHDARAPGRATRQRRLRRPSPPPAWAPPPSISPSPPSPPPSPLTAAAVFMGEEECEYDDAGRFFFDHDPTHFNLILNFMRTTDCNIPYERGAFEAFRKDVQYWRLDTLEARVRDGGRAGRRIHLLSTCAIRLSPPPTQLPGVSPPRFSLFFSLAGGHPLQEAHPAPARRREGHGQRREAQGPQRDGGARQVHGQAEGAPRRNRREDLQHRPRGERRGGGGRGTRRDGLPGDDGGRRARLRERERPQTSHLVSSPHRPDHITRRPSWRVPRPATAA